MATPAELLRSMEVALERGREAQAASVDAMAAAMSRVKATGVRVQSQASVGGVRASFSDNPRSRAQVRLNPADVAAKAAERVSRVGEEALRDAVSRS